MRDFYELPLLYDVLHAPGTAAELDGLERMAERYGGIGHEALGTGQKSARRADLPRWLEPACGTGRLVRLAARRGIACVGFDRSEEMVGYARERLERQRARSPSAAHAAVHVADMTRFADVCGAGAFDFAFCTINTIRHLADDRALLAHLDQMRLALRPRGLYAVGISLSAYGYESPSEDLWEGRRGTLGVRQLVSYLPPERGERIERVISVLTVTRPRGEEHIESTYTLRTYDTSEWSDILARAGWGPIAVCDEAGSEIELREPGYGIFLLAPR